MTFTCPICLDDNEANIESVGTLQPCNHKFHTDCLRRWHLYAHDLLCPVCRAESNSLLVKLSGDEGMTPIKVDLRKGFYAKKAIEYERQEEQFLRRFNNALRFESPLSRQERLVLIQCNICGESESQLDKACHNCGTLFHESCLRSLACEVGDPSSWQQCVECQDPVNQFYRSHVDYENSTSSRSLQMPDELRRLREVKTVIQGHVRQVLQGFYRGDNDGDLRNKLDRKHFADINKRVSRKLYRVSNYRYLRGIIDYDTEARREVCLELRNLGYIDV